MLHVVDFRTSAGDTGRSNSDSIEPYNDGEAADQVTFRRPTEHNRARTQTLRERVRELLWRADFDQTSYALLGGDEITVSAGTTHHIFSLGDDLSIFPFPTVGGTGGVESTKSSLSIGTPSVNELVFTSVQKAFEGSTAAADVNDISVEINDEGSGASLSISVTDRHIKIGIDEGVHTCNHVITLVTGDAAASLLVTCALGSGSTGTNTAPTHEAWSNYEDRYLRGGVPGVQHVISSSGLATFFSTPANELDVGDCLAIEYDKIYNPTTTGGRLQSTVENTNTDVDGALFNTRRYPEKVPNCIPICKHVDTGEMVFLNGARIRQGTPATLMNDSYALLSAEFGLLRTPLNWDRIGDGPDHNPPTTIRHALDNADGHLDYLLNHTAAFVSVTDGTTSTGGQYNGTTALNDALNAYKDIGATIFVRPGAYTCATQMTFTKPMRIIGMGQVSVNFTFGGSGYVWTFAAAARGSILKNMQGVGGTLSANEYIEVQADGMRIENLGNGAAVEGKIRIHADRVTVRNCAFYSESNICIEQTSSSTETRVEQCRFNSGDVGVTFLFLAGEGSISNCHLVADVGDTRAIYTGPTSNNLHFSDITIEGYATASTSYLTHISGYGHSFISLKIKCLGTAGHGTNQIATSLLYVNGNDIDFFDIEVNGGDREIAEFDLDHNPLRFQGNNIIVRGLDFHNFSWYWDTPSGSGWSRYAACVALIGDDGSDFKNGVVSLVDSHIREFGFVGTIGANHAEGVLVGSNDWWSGAGPAGSNGHFVMRNVTVDSVGRSGGDPLDANMVVGNIPPGSLIDSCHFYEGSYRWHILASYCDRVQIVNNVIRYSGEGTYVVSGTCIQLDSAGSDYCKLNYNTIYHRSGEWSGINLNGTGPSTDNQCIGNTVRNTGGAAPTHSIAISNQTRGIVRNNNVDNGITYVTGCTSMIPATITGAENQL